MTATALFSKPARDEQTAIARALARWGAYDALAESTFLIKGGSSRVVCMVSPELAQHVLKLQPGAAGLGIGELGKRHFIPTVAGADLFARAAQGGAGKYYVAVNENAEKLVLYGRNVMGGSMLRAAADLDENELVILVNGRGEAIGVGRTRFAGRALFQKERITITTVADAGRYLRDEDESKAKMATRISAAEDKERERDGQERRP
ncbi:MAG: ribosomal biogenesis protein [Nitrososphaera sp.]